MVSQPHPGTTGPIVFALPGVKADTNLEVFDQAFHVHSHILRTHSAFFRRFMDSADKTQPAGDTFRYHYKTQVDSDGIWGLEAASKITSEIPADTLERNKINTQKEITAFNKLMSAMYMRTYTIVDTNELEILIRLADYYCALPALSSSLYVALFDKKGVAKEIPTRARQLLPLAYKLRQPLLFRECMIHVVGSLKDDCGRLYDNQVLDNAVKVQYGRLCHKIAMTFYRLNFCSQNLYDKGAKADAQEAIPSYCNDFTPTSSMRFFRHVYYHSYKLNAVKERVMETIAPLLENNLKLDASHGKLGETRFLCLEIDEEDLPWDLTETDW